MRLPTITAVLFLGMLACNSARADKIDDYIKDQMQRRQLPGVAVGVMHRGKEVKLGCYGLANLELSAPVNKDTAFEVGAITTEFTAAGIMLLVEDGKISLDDPISRYFRQAPSQWNNITVRHLLSNSSGLKSFTGLKGFELTKRLTQTQFLEQISNHQLEGRPGDKAIYCATGYALLGYIIENVSGQPYWTFLNNRLFQPLGMMNTGNRDPLILAPNRADGYERSKAGVLENRDYDLTDMFSAGALRISVTDLMKWDAAFTSGKILSSSSRELMQTPGKNNKGQPHLFGFGCRVDTEKVFVRVSNTGTTSGFSASYQRFPELGLSVIVLVNISDESGKRSSANDLSQEIASFYLDAK